MKTPRLILTGGSAARLTPVYDGLGSEPLPQSSFFISRIALNNGGAGGDAAQPLTIDETIGINFRDGAAAVDWLNNTFIPAHGLQSSFNLAAGNYLNYQNYPEQFETATITIVLGQGEYDQEYDIEYN